MTERTNTGPPRTLGGKLREIVEIDPLLAYQFPRTDLYRLMLEAADRIDALERRADGLCRACGLRDATPGRADGLCSECYADAA